MSDKKLANGWYTYHYNGYHFWIIRADVLFEHYGWTDIDRNEEPVNKSLWFSTQIDNNGDPLEPVRTRELENLVSGTTKKGCEEMIRFILDRAKGQDGRS